ncbi:MAG: hypothetical protein IKB40_04155 [Paludibacteraceae bacterium]|nr:hypothetical protein [Paludibacteraceae bacterium]
MKRTLIILIAMGYGLLVIAQNIPVPLTQVKLYDFLDELLTDGVVVHQTAVRPYSRQQVAKMLMAAQTADSLLNVRQKKDLAFYLNEFALERDTMVSNYVQYTDHSTYNLSLADPQFSYRSKNSMFKMRLRPILGADVTASKKGVLLQRWWGAELQMDIANHVSIWGSLRDNSWSGNWLSKKYYPDDNDRMYGARIHYGASRIQPALTPMTGVQYKEANYGGDFSDSKGGISLYSWWGNIAVQRENIRWGDAYHASNILSGRAPAVPMISLQLTPCKWFQFDYFHAWLVSNIMDSTYYYLENTTKGDVQVKNYRPMNKFMAANMFTFTPIKHLSFSVGNSIIYAEQTIQAAYLIPIAFYKSLDHLLTKGLITQNQNSQAFASLSVRPVKHLQLYGSFYLDEFSIKRLKPSNQENNPISYLVGFNWSGWPIKGLSLKGEFMRSYIACYTHSIDALTWQSNSFDMGHYMGDNAQSIYAELAYRPTRGMLIKMSYTHDTKYNSYAYLRRYRTATEDIRDGGISETLAQKPFDHAIFRNEVVRLDGIYEVHPNMYLTLALEYNNARGFNNQKTNAIKSEDIGDAQYYLDKYMPLYYQGKNLTVSAAFSFGF